MSFPAFPPSSSSIPQGQGQMQEEEQRLLDFRNATNLRSVRRADPSVSAILETSVYSTVYCYDEGSEKWEKQKQEGPLFVVRRDKTPEYALYMLNRQTMKNPMIPLIPGEMKLTVVDSTMLQVARRGEKLRMAIWFSEGTEAVEKFRSAVLRICGEPSRRPDAVASPAIIAPPPVPAQEDGLSRLFAGLMKSPPVQSPTIQSPQISRGPSQPAAPTVQSTTTTYTTTTVTSAPPSQPEHRPQPQPLLPIQLQQPPFVPAPLPEPSYTTSPPPRLPSPPTGPPGQTADDLLMSILGLAPPSVPPSAIPNGAVPPISQPAPAQNGQYVPPPPAMISQLQHASYQQVQPLPPPPAPFLSPPNGHQHPQSRKVGDATFAQTAASTSPHPPSPLPPHTGVGVASPVTLLHSPSTSGFRGGTESRSIAAEAVIDGIERKERDEGISIAGIGLGAEQRKREFVRRLTDMILSDERFVDDLWMRYLDRMSRGGSQGG